MNTSITSKTFLAGLIITVLFFSAKAYSQELTQTFRGRVLDAYTELPLPGATVVALGSDPLRGTATNGNGEFRIDGLPLGRINIQVSMVGYQPAVLNNLLLRSGRELVMDIALEEQVYAMDDVTIRLDSNQASSALAHVEDQWTEFAGDAPFVWSFLDEDLIQHYSQDIRTRNIFEIFALLAIFIAALGLLGMASFNTEKRTREIGVRKAMGASPSSIILLMSKEINMLVLTAAIISWPAAWFLMDRWLDNFAYRIEQGIPTFLAATVITYIIALLTVGLQAWRAANLNPVDVLRDE